MFSRPVKCNVDCIDRQCTLFYLRTTHIVNLPSKLIMWLIFPRETPLSQSIVKKISIPLQKLGSNKRNVRKPSTILTPFHSIQSLPWSGGSYETLGVEFVAYGNGVSGRYDKKNNKKKNYRNGVLCT